MREVRLTGDLDRDAEAQLDAAYVGEDVTLDFSDVGYINSSGIALIVALLARARVDGRLVRARGLSEHYREIFAITRLSDFMEIT